MGKHYLEANVLDASRARIAATFDTVERVYIAFSGGKVAAVGAAADIAGEEPDGSPDHHADECRNQTHQ
jgi:hypothetical protein